MKFYNFAHHNGVRFLSPLTNLIKPVLLGHVVAHNLVSNTRRFELLNALMSDYSWNTRMMQGFRLKTSMVEISKPGFSRSCLTSGGKVLLNGASGDRARGLIRKRLEYSIESNQIISDYFSSMADLPSVKEAPSSADIWIESKNYSNYFHFLTESLHKAYLQNDILRQAKRISFVAQRNEIHQFVHKWISAGAGLGCPMPNLVTEKREIPKAAVLTPFSAKHLLYQFNGDHHKTINDARPAGDAWQKYDASSHSVTTLEMNSYDDSLEDYRRRMIDLADRNISENWGKRIYAARSPDAVRKRVMQGEQLLIDALSQSGFEVVYFENLSPLEQIKCINGAECVVMQHGAGMTNMLFCAENAHLFELGTFQTAFSRWKHFMPLCHIAGCHYHHMFLDMDFDDEAVDPVYSKDGLVAPVISREKIDDIMEVIFTSLADTHSGRVSGFIEHAERLMSKTAYKKTFRLLDKIKPLAGDRGEFWELRSELNERCGRMEPARTDLIRSWEISKSHSAKSRFFSLTEESDERRSLFV